MQCPKCKSQMEPVLYEGVEVDRCTSCKGLWLDLGEREDLAGAEAASAIDVGDARVGAAMNPIDRYPCPRCHGGMVRMVDPKQPHIWYEKCASCGGSFFDAGELRDLASVGIADFFKDLFARERR